MSLVAHYQFEDVYTDDSGNSHTLTPSGSPTFVDGKVGRALSLNGSSQHATTPSVPAFSVQAGLTIAAWVYPTNLSGGSSFGSDNPRFIFHRDVASRMTFGLRMLGGRLDYLYRNDDDTSYATLRADAENLVVDQWQHVAVTQAGSTAVLYVDGSPIAATNVVGALADDNQQRVNEDSYIGAQNGTQRRFQGHLDSLIIRSDALTAQEIADLASDDPDALPLAHHHGAAA